MAAMQVQAEEARRRQVREVAYDLQRRMKQELAFPAVIHFYCWLLQGESFIHSFIHSVYQVVWVNHDHLTGDAAQATRQRIVLHVLASQQD